LQTRKRKNRTPRKDVGNCRQKAPLESGELTWAFIGIAAKHLDKGGGGWAPMKRGAELGKSSREGLGEHW